MANFDKEFDKLILVEGGYSFDPDDAGGETYLGISRKANPQWRGWVYIDEVKKANKNVSNSKLTFILKSNDNITKSAKRLYKNMYWDIIDLDDIPSQKIAHQLFDTAVNCGVSRAIRIAQQVVGMTITGKWSNELRYNLMQYGE
jgi:lysozyme family protein